MIAALRAAELKLNARAGKKEGGCGEEIFARPRFRHFFFFAAAIFRISLCEMCRQKRSCVCPAHPCAHNRFAPFILLAKFNII